MKNSALGQVFKGVLLGLAGYIVYAVIVFVCGT